jgi:hypothetical protein
MNYRQGVLGAVVATVLSYPAVPAAENPSFVSVELRKQGDRTSSATSPVQTARKDSAGRWGDYDLRVVIKIPTGSADHAVVRASFDAILAPRVLPPVLQGKDLRKHMPWERVLGLDWFARFRPLPSYHHPRFKATLTTLMLDDAIKRSFSSEDSEWPWIVRATVTISEFDGTVLATEHREIELGPPTDGK